MLRSSELGFEFKLAVALDIKDMQQTVFESFLERLLNLPSKLLKGNCCGLWEKKVCLYTVNVILVPQVLFPRRKPNSANISGNFS